MDWNGMYVQTCIWKVVGLWKNVLLILIAPLWLFSGKAEKGKNVNVNVSEEVWRGEQTSGKVHLLSATLVINIYSTMKVNCMKILIIKF